MNYNCIHSILGRLIVIFGFLVVSCSKDTPIKVEEEVPEGSDSDSIPPIVIDTNEPKFEGDTGNVVVYDSVKIDKGYILINDADDNRVYLMTKEAKIIYEWMLPSGIGNDAELLEDGRLLVSLNAEDPFYNIGGYGGRIQLINPDRSIDWDFHYSSEEHISHHDVEMLPNGNVLIMTWEKKSSDEAIQAGYDNSPVNEVLLPEAILEINPLNDEIVWEWHSWNHLIQDFDNTKDNFGNVAQNPQLININFHDDDRGDIMHANGLDYDAKNDLIYLSVNFYSEVWVIDHSTTKAEAISHEGGKYNMGGDILYRFGNPSAYNNSEGTRLFYSNHFPNILNENEIGSGNMLIYMNGNDGSSEPQSIVYELSIPSSFEVNPENDNEPDVIWSFTDSELYSPLVGGAVRLPNGNTLITEGRYGYWEVTPNKEVVWKFDGNKLFWRGYSYPLNHPAINLLELNLE